MINNLLKGTLAVIVATIVIMSMLPLFQEFDDDVLDVIVIDGQSNAEYYRDNNGMVNISEVNSVLGAPHHKILYYGTSTQPAGYHQRNDLDSYSIHEAYVNGSYVVGSLLAPLGYYYSEKSGHDILIINAGVAGSPIEGLVPDSTGGEWRSDLIDHVMPLIHGYSKINKIGWVWLQGESDKNTPISSYKESFYEIQEYYETIGYDNCYIVKTMYEHGKNATIAQAQLIIESSNIYLGTDITDTFPGTPMMKADNVHYTQAGRILIAGDLTKVLPVEKDGSETLMTLVSTIPIILIAALLLGIIGTVLYKKLN